MTSRTFAKERIAASGGTYRNSSGRSCASTSGGRLLTQATSPPASPTATTPAPPSRTYRMRVVMVMIS